MDNIVTMVVAALAFLVCFTLGMKMGNFGASKHKDRRSGKK